MEKRRFGVVATLWFVVAITALLLYMGRSMLVAPSGAAPAPFSEEHAFATLSSLLREQRPHTAGSLENAVVRDRIVAELKSAGYVPEVQAVLQCSTETRAPGCTQVENIIALHKGTAAAGAGTAAAGEGTAAVGGGKAVLVSAHYDSVPAGPGVGDDGVGVAVVLEAARAFASRSTRNDIIFLITDGEETGLRGARAFAERHPLMRRVGVLVNFDARGASGPSTMFETGPGNARLMDLFSHAVSRPTATSLAYAIAKLLPNDTDFSVYRKMGLSGFNFAFTNSASLYHSSRDNLRYIDPATLQHSGEHAFEVTAALADADLATLNASADASYFDIFGWVLATWPLALDLPLALLALCALAVLVFAHRKAFTVRSTVWAVAAFIAVPLLLFGAGWLLSYPLGIWPGAHPLDHPHPWPARVALLTAGMLVALLVAAFAGRRADARALLLVNWIGLAILALVVSMTVGGATYPLLWPALAVAIVAGIETLVGGGRARSLRVTGFVGFALTAFFWLAFLLAMEVVFGFSLSQFKMLVLIPYSLALVGVFAASAGKQTRGLWALSALCALVVAGAAGFASQMPAFEPDHPRGLNITYYDDRGAKPRWFVASVGAPDEEYLSAHGFPQQDEDFLWGGVLKARGRLKPAAAQNLVAPTFTVKEIASRDGSTVARGVLRSGRGGFLLGLAMAPHSGVQSIRLDHQETVSAAQLNGKDPIFVQFWGLESREVPLEIAFDATTTPKVVLFERSRLPDSEEARVLVTDRPADSTPAYTGDSALVYVAVELKS